MSEPKVGNLMGTCGAQVEVYLDDGGVPQTYKTVCANAAASQVAPTELPNICMVCPHAAGMPEQGDAPIETTPVAELPSPVSPPKPPTIADGLELAEAAAKMQGINLHPQASPVSVVDKTTAKLVERQEDAAVSLDVFQIESGLLKDEADLDYEAIIESFPELQGGPSEGGISSHKLVPHARCKRESYYRHVLGLRRKTKSTAFSIGSLFHAIMELHFRTGGAKREELIDAVQQAGAVETAAMLRVMVRSYLGKYAQDHAARWDLRGIELNLTAFMGPYSIGRKQQYVPLTCRLDLLLAILRAGQARQPFGQPHPNGVWMQDYKTFTRLSSDLLSGYNRDIQFLHNAFVWHNGGYNESMGRLNGVIVDLVRKGKRIDKKKGAEQLLVPISEQDLANYGRYLLPEAVDLAQRVACEEMRSNIEAWPQNLTACHRKYSACPFYELCDLGMTESTLCNYKKHEPNIIDVESFAKPPKELVTQRKQAQVQADIDAGVESKAVKAAKRKQEREQLKELVLDALEREDDRPFPLPDPKDFDLAKQPAARKAVADRLKELVVAGERTMLVGDENDYEELVVKPGAKSISWKFRGARGTVAWSAVAKFLTRSWWDHTKGRTERAPDDKAA